MSNVRPAVRRKTTRQIFGVPLLVSLLSAIGLMSALVGDGVWDGVSWATLLIPILLGGYCLVKAGR